MSDEAQPKKVVSQHKRNGFGKRRLDNSEMFERILRVELEALYRKIQGNKKKGKPGVPLTPEEARKLESLTRAQANLDELKSVQALADAEAESEADSFSPEELRRAMNELKKQTIQE